MQSWPTRTEKRPTMSQHDFSAVVAALEAAAAERRTALDLLIAASDRASRMADAQARVAEAPSRVAIFVGHGKRALWLGTALSVVLLAGGVAARIAHPAFLGPAALTGLSDAISSSPNSAPDLGRLPKPESAPEIGDELHDLPRSDSERRAVDGWASILRVWMTRFGTRRGATPTCPAPMARPSRSHLANRDAPDAPIIYPEDLPGWAAVKMDAEIARVLGESCPWIEPYEA